MDRSSDVQTVQVRVQVIDMRSFTLDLVLPTYLPARDLTQRVARDAGLDAFWPDGKRRLYWLRARGRLMTEEERLSDMGVVPGELIHLLPEPPAGSPVMEQTPDYPETRGYAASGTLALISSLTMVTLFAVGWGLALSWQRTLPVIIIPGLGLGLLTCSLARYLFSGDGGQARIAAVGLVLTVLLVILAFAPVLFLGADPAQLFSEAMPGLISALAGVLMGWLAWWGAVEPLPPRRNQVQEQVVEAVQMGPCGICGLGVSPDVRTDCQYACGKSFHTGCYAARASVSRVDPSRCAICNVQVRQA